VKLWHDVAGAGPPVLLVHAGICDARMWDPQWRTFPSVRRTIRCDLRGFGNTRMPPEPFSNARDLAELVEALDAVPAAVVGVSMGGLAALDLAFARPELVAAIVLVGAPLPDHDWSPEMDRFDAAEEAALERGDLDEAVELNLMMWVDGPLRGRGEVDPDLRRRVAAMQRRAFELQLAAGDEAVDELLVPDLGGRLGELEVPVMAVTGELDCEDILVIADRLEREIPDCRRATIERTAHVPSMERPEVFDELVLGFLAERF
jgi:3-oxoadipate enol-lactonase